MSKRKGWERMVYAGTAGSAAATLVGNVTDADLGEDHTFEDSSDRGDGTATPKKTEQITQLGATPTFKFRYNNSSAIQATILAATEAGTGMAIKFVKYNGGDTEFDGDCYLKRNTPGPLTGGMECEIECHPTDDYGRAWTF